MAGTLVLFWAFAGLALASALGCITRRSPVASALWLVVTLFALAALFVLLDAQFIAVLQLLVYAGAIMVLFLFVIMLLNLGRPGPMDVKGPVGVGIAFSFVPVTIAALAGVSHDAAGLGSGLINTSQQIGGAIGVAFASTVITSHIGTGRVTLQTLMS